MINKRESVNETIPEIITVDEQVMYLEEVKQSPE